jgi:hypothetical protein
MSRAPREHFKPLLTVPLRFIAAWMVCAAVVLAVYGLVALSR